MGVQVCKQSEQKKWSWTQYSTRNKQLWDTFPGQDFFPDMLQISWHF